LNAKGAKSRIFQDNTLVITMVTAGGEMTRTKHIVRWTHKNIRRGRVCNVQIRGVTFLKL